MAQIRTKTKAVLALASGRVFPGYHFGAHPTEKSSGEVVFNTSLTGYQEILTDPSYQGQIVVMTPSHIGNTGVNLDDIESKKVFLSGFVIQELSGITSNYRSKENLDDFLGKAGVVGIEGVDTRTLTRHLRSQGAVNGLIAIEPKNIAEVIKKAKSLPGLEGRDLVKEVTSNTSYEWKEGTLKEFYAATKTIAKNKKKVVVMDFGVKRNILRSLVDRNCDVTVVPATTSSDEIMRYKPDGVVFSNGPGDPAAVGYAIRTIRELVEESANREKKQEKLALFGICLGHQLLGLALGGKTYKLKFGHHGANHPIKDLETGQVDVTAQNHGFCVEAEKSSSGKLTVKGNKDAIVTHLNLNDNAVEGLRHKTLPIFSVQYHPEASAGPHDAEHLFNRFMKLMEN